jgi:hypothetical protein
MIDKYVSVQKNKKHKMQIFLTYFEGHMTDAASLAAKASGSRGESKYWAFILEGNFPVRPQANTSGVDSSISKIYIYITFILSLLTSFIDIFIAQLILEIDFNMILSYHISFQKASLREGHDEGPPPPPTPSRKVRVF